MCKTNFLQAQISTNARKSIMEMETKQLIHIRQGIYLILKPKEISTLDEAREMVRFLLKTIEQVGKQKDKQQQLENAIEKTVRELVVGVRELVSEADCNWMCNMQKEQRLQVQLFLRFCLLKFQKILINRTNLSSICSSNTHNYKEEIITIINQLKIENPSFDIPECIKTILQNISALICPSFNHFVVELIQYFSLEKHSKYLIQESCSISQTPTKNKQRQYLMKDLNSICREPLKTLGKATTSTKAPPQTPTSSLRLQFRKHKQSTERTIYYSHPFKYTFKKREYGLN